MHKIVIIDDSLEDRETYKRYLKKASSNKYEFIEADSAEEGIDICLKHEPHCIILDYSLPDLNAKETLVRLKTHINILPVIVITGQGSESIAVDLMRNGAQDYLIKSGITQEALHRAVHNTIERVNLLKSIVATEKELKTVLDTVVDGIVVIDSKGIMQSANPAVEKLFGYKKKELIGQNVRMLMPKTYATEHDSYLSNYLKTGKAKIIGIGREVEGMRKGGSVFPMDLGINVMDSDGQKKFVGTLKDITDRKEKEKQIIIEKERADHANRAKSMFLATMSHEIRTPMNGIIGVAELLSYSDLNEKESRYVDTIQSSGELLLVLINDILDFSKIEAGELELESAPIVINALLAEIVHMLSTRANDNEVELALRCPQNIPMSVYADPVRLRQILINIVGNAIKFSKGGHVLINVLNIEETEDKVTLRVEVEDTGIGIPKDKLSTIFEQFIQADSDTTRQFGGTGLGLAICKRLVELMGGEVGVKSKVGEGSTFWFEVTFDSHLENKVAKIDEARKLHGKHILIVDDYDINLEVFSEYLKKIDVDSETTNSPHDALERVAKAYKSGKPYDIILVDYIMPKMNGEMFGHTIKGSKEKFGNPKMLMLTAMGKKDDFSDIEKAGFSDHLMKPIYPHILIDTIIKVLDTEDVDSIQTADEIVDKSLKHDALAKFDANILVVEDNRTNQFYTDSLLKELGCSVDMAEDGNVALAILKKNKTKYDLIFMDWQMPKKDGIQTTKEIRKQKWGKDLTIIALTANAMQGDKEKCLKAGMDDYVSKPIKMVDLQKIFEKYILTKKQGKKTKKVK